MTRLQAIICGVALAAIIALALLWRFADARGDRWQARAEERLASHQAFAANVRAATAEAERADAANARRVETEQAAINERTTDAYETRIADARARYERLRDDAAHADRSGGGTAPMPGVPAAPGQADGAAGGDGLSLPERLIATETALRLEALQAWNREQAGVDIGGEAQ